MKHRLRNSIVAAAGSVSVVLAGGGTASAATVRVSDPQVFAHLDIAKGQTVEAFAVEPSGAVDLSLSFANEVVRVGPNGKQTVLAQLPAGGSCPALGPSETLGIARAHDGALYVAECSGDAHTGIWKVRPGAAPVQIAQLPADHIPDGVALDDATGDLYVTDSLHGEVWKVPTHGGAAELWASGPELLGTPTYFGGHGITIHDGSVWVENSSYGTVMEIPVRHDGTAGAISTVATGLPFGVDGFVVLDGHDCGGSASDDVTIIAASVLGDQVVALKPGGQPQVLLTAADGLQNPNKVALVGDRLYVSSSAYVSGVDPNMLVAHFRY